MVSGKTTKEIKIMYQLFDTFNNCKISNHRSFESAEKATVAHYKAVKKRHGHSAYVPTEIRVNGKAVGRY